MKTALIAGATGLVGSEVLSLLLESGNYSKVISIVRKEASVSHPKLEQLVIDFDKMEKYQDQMVADDIFCCLGTTMKKAGSKENFFKVDFTYPVKLAYIAEKNKAQQYLIVSAMGADRKSFFFYNRVKGEAEEALSKLKFKSTIVLRPSLILGDRKEKRLGEDFAKAISGPLSLLLFGPMKKLRPIEARQIAEGMVILAQKDLDGLHVIESEEIKTV